MLNMLTLLQQGMTTGDGLAIGLAVLGGGLSALAAGIGIGQIGGRMTEAMARQPSEAQNIQTAAIVLAVFIEGAALVGLVIAGFIRS